MHIYSQHHLHIAPKKVIIKYSLCPMMKSAILVFLNKLVRKDSHALICWLHAVSFDMQIKSNNLIMEIVKIQFIELHSL